MHEQCAQISIPSLRYAQLANASTGSRLSWGKAQPCRKLSARLELIEVASFCNHGSSRKQADTRNRLKCLSISTEIFPGVSAEKFPVERVKSECLSALFALFKPVGVVAGFEDVAVMGDAVE